MAKPALEAGWLQGKQVAFTGRLACLTRAEAARLVQSQGGLFVTAVTRRTHFLIVGQEGLPLTKKGGLTNKLKKARRLQATGRPMVFSEEDFLARLGLHERSAEIHRLYSTAQVCRLVRLPRDRLRAWLRQGLVKAEQTVQGVDHFNFSQVAAIKSLWELACSGVAGEKIRRSLRQLQQWLPGWEHPLTLLEQDGQLLIRLRDGQMAEPTGQLHLDFSEDTPPLVVTCTPPPPTVDELWQRGLNHESLGNWQGARDTYREALDTGGPNPALCFNLGNVLYQLDQKEAAAESFRQAAQLDPNFAEAWNNLGNVLAELGMMEDSLAAYQQALKNNPASADSHYNLADTLEDLGRSSEARTHWQSYVRLEPIGPWANYARRRLGS